MSEAPFVISLSIGLGLLGGWLWARWRANVAKELRAIRQLLERLEHLEEQELGNKPDKRAGA